MSVNGYSKFGFFILFEQLHGFISLCDIFLAVDGLIHIPGTPITFGPI